MQPSPADREAGEQMAQPEPEAGPPQNPEHPALAHYQEQALLAMEMAPVRVHQAVQPLAWAAEEQQQA